MIADRAAVAVVTGASRGIGHAVASRLAASGLTVIAAARSAADLDRLAAATPGVIPLVVDVGEEAGVETAVSKALSHGTLRVWVNNAAVADHVLLAELDTARWDRVLAVNLRAAFLGCRAALRHMAGGGTVVTMSSLSGVPFVEKFPGLGAYNASKAALVSLSETVAIEGRDRGIRSVAICPGAVDTEMLRQAAPHLRPAATPADVAELVAFIVSDAGAILSGSTIPLFTNR